MKQFYNFLRKMKNILKHIIKFISTWLLIGFWFVVSIYFFVKAAWLTATSWEPLTASKWTDMASNFFWWSGSWGIFYNGKVWIWTSSPNRSLHVYDTTDNAEIDIQSVAWVGKHWWIYQNSSNQNLHMRNSSDRIIITTWGNLNVGWTVNAWGTLNAAWWICMNWDCKNSWAQIWGSSLWIYQFTWTSITCDSANSGKVRYSSSNKILEFCNGSIWKTVWTELKWTIANPWGSCKDILISWDSWWDWIYRIKPDTTSIQVYCDMTTNWWWWTLISYANQRWSWMQSLKTWWGTRDPSNRTNIASLNALTLARNSTEMALSYKNTTNYNWNINNSTAAVKFTLQNPWNITFDWADPGSCVQVSYTNIKWWSSVNLYTYAKALMHYAANDYWITETVACNNFAWNSWSFGSTTRDWAYAWGSYTNEWSVWIWVK